MNSVTIKQHDTKITFRDIPTINGAAVPPANFAGCTVSFVMKGDDTTITPIKQAALINGDGTFSYAPVPTDVASIGNFKQEWEVVYPDTSRLTFPNGGYNLVKIIADLG
jgi:hypothetical protein